MTLPVKPQGNKYIIVMIDLFSRYIHAVALPNQNAQTVCTALLHSWVLRFGAPRKILTDQGTNFESEISLIFACFGVSRRPEPLRFNRLRMALAKE